MTSSDADHGTSTSEIDTPGAEGAEATLLLDGTPASVDGASIEPAAVDADAAAARAVEEDEVDAEVRRQRLMRWTSAIVVGACCLYVFWVVHPELIFRNTTPTGGDMGAHVWGPAYLRDHLLPQLRLSGWTPDWYNGFPAYSFYMVVPSLAIVALDVGVLPWFLGPVLAAGVAYVGRLLWQRWTSPLARVATAVVGAAVVVLSVDVPYNIAFKMVTVLGLVTLPAGVWWLGHNLGLRFGGPELMAIASVPFLMDRTLFHIYGGNIASTMAGEFAFSISLSFGLFFLGTVARGIRTGRHVALAAVLAALCALNHVIPAIYCAIAALVILAFRPTKRALVWALQVAPVGILLVAFWYLPFYFNSAYMNDMGWEKLGPLKNQFGVNIFNSTEFWRYLLPFAPHTADSGTTAADPDMLFGKVFFVLAIIGFALSLVKRVRAGLVLATILVLSGVAFRYMPQGRFWNARVLPLYYLCVYLLAAVGVYLLLTVISQAFLALSRGGRLGTAAATVGAIYVAVLLGVEQVWPFLATATQGDRIAVVAALLLGPLAVGVTARIPSLRDAGPSLATGVAAVVVAITAVVGVDPIDPVSTLQVAIGLVLAVCLLCGAVYLDATANRAVYADSWGPEWMARLAVGSPKFATPLSAVAVVGLAALVVYVAMGMTLRTLPGGELVTDVGDPADASDDVTQYAWGPFRTSYHGVARSWAEYNYRGLEDKRSGDKDWSAEYFGVVGEVERVGREHGCGRMMWEYDGDRMNNYGTPMAFMLFPYFTDGCIGSQEGLYFEASATTPFHFLMQSELSAQCSCAQRFDIFGFKNSPYRGFDLDLGIQHMQLMGIRYYLAVSDTAKEAAKDDPRLIEVGRAEPYVVYEVTDSPIVRGLSSLPEVWPNVPEAAHDRVGPIAQWFMDPERWEVVPASDGPEEWPRNEAVTGPGHDELTDEEREQARQSFTAEQVEEISKAKRNVPVLQPLPEGKPKVPVREAQVSNITTTTDSISFEVDEPGTPVLVTESYFPNWKAEGAEGPWRVGPNMMVVVPTQEKVTLTYGRSGLELGSLGLSFLGLLALAFLLHRGEWVVGRDPRELAGDRDVEPSSDDAVEPSAGEVDTTEASRAPDGPDGSDAAGGTVGSG